MERIIELIIDEENEFSGIEAISVVENPAIEEEFIALKKQPIQLAEVDSEKRILMGPALIPDRKILRKDDDGEYYIYFSKETVRKASELFLMKGNQNNSTLEHQDVLKGMSVVESWIIEDKKKDKSKKYKMDLPLNTWMISVKVLNDEIWNQVKEGEINGFSIEGYFADKAERPKESIKEKFKSIVVNKDFAIIDDRLAYSSIDKAIEVSKEINCVGYHEHEYEGNTWYMPCEKHIVENEAETILKKLTSELEELLEEENLESYSDYPSAVKNNAKKGIELNKKVNNKCATQVGKIRAQQLAKGEALTTSTIKRMFSYLSRAKEYYDEGNTKACGTISYLLWGGKAGLRWSGAKLKELELKEEEKMLSLEKTELSEKKYSYPDAVKNNAKRALSFKKNNPHSSCGTKSGWEAAKLLSSGNRP